MSLRIDGSLSPDEPPPVVHDSLTERVDYLVRLCSAWDFGILPDGEALREIRRRSTSWGASPPPSGRIQTSSSCEERLLAGYRWCGVRSRSLGGLAYGREASAVGHRLEDREIRNHAEVWIL